MKVLSGNILKSFPGLIGAMLLICASGTQAQAQAQDGLDVRLNPGDRVQISVFGHEDLSGEFELDHRGRLSLPLINDVVAEGSTTDELALQIVDLLQPDYLINPRVNVRLISLRPVYVIGEVGQPGSYPYSTGMTVVKAVALAGGYTPRARTRRVAIKRNVEGEQLTLPAELEMRVLPGDIIEVPERFF